MYLERMKERSKERRRVGVSFVRFGEHYMYYASIAYCYVTIKVGEVPKSWLQPL